MADEHERLLLSTASENHASVGLSSSYNNTNEFLRSLHTTYMSSPVSYGTTIAVLQIGPESEAFPNTSEMNGFATAAPKIQSVEHVSGSSSPRLWSLPLKKKLMLSFLAAGNVIHMMAYSLIAPFFPREAQLKGVSPTTIGFIFSTYMLVSFLISPVYGTNITRIGPRFMFIAGLCVGGACAILFGLLEYCPPGPPFIALCFLTRLMEALGMSAHTTVSFAIASNEFFDNIATVYGILEGASSFGFMIGPVAGSFLYEAGGFGLPFYVMGGVTLMGGALVLTCLPKQMDTHQKEQRSKLALLRSTHMWVILLVVYMCAFGNGFIDASLAIHVERQFGLSSVYIGLIFTIWSVVYAFTAPFWGWLTDKKDIAVPLIELGVLLCGISLLLIGPSPLLPFLPSSLWVMILGLCVNSLAIGWAIVPTMKCLIVGARDLGFGDNLDTFGVVSGLFQCFLSLGAFSGPFVGGIMIENMGFDMSATIVGFIYLFLMLVTTVYFCLRHKC